MRYKTNQIISFEEYLYWQNMGLPYTGFVKGKGYTFPYYSPVQIPLVENNRVQWNTWINHPVRTQIWDTSPQAIFRSMDYSPEDIINHIKKDNGDGTVTFTLGMDKITVPSDPNKHNIYIQIDETSDSYRVSVCIQDKVNNQSYCRTITYNEETVNSVGQQSNKIGEQSNSARNDVLDIIKDIENYNTGIGVAVGTLETGLKPIVEKIHPLRPLYYSDGPIYKPALPGYNWRGISGEFLEKSFKNIKIIGRYSGGLGIVLTGARFFDEDSSWEKVAVDEVFNIIGLFSLPGFIISTSYTAVDVFYPNGWKGLFDDISKNLYEMYMNQVNENGVMMAPWIFGK